MKPQKLVAAIVKPTIWPDPPVDELQAKHRTAVHAEKVAMIAAALDVDKIVALVEAVHGVVSWGRAGDLEWAVSYLSNALAAFRGDAIRGEVG